MWTFKRKDWKRKKHSFFWNDSYQIKHMYTCHAIYYVICSSFLQFSDLLGNQVFSSDGSHNWWVSHPPTFRRPVRSNGSHLQWCGRMRRKFAHFLFSTTFLLQIRMEVVWLVKQSYHWWCIWDSDLGGCLNNFLEGGEGKKECVPTCWNSHILGWIIVEPHFFTQRSYPAVHEFYWNSWEHNPLSSSGGRMRKAYFASLVVF